MIPNATRRFTPKHRSAAAPTAGLHFTTELLDALKAKGVKLAFVTLHVGLGTFRPVKEDEITDHIMHSEYYIMDEETAGSSTIRVRRRQDLGGRHNSHPHAGDHRG